MTRLWLVLLLLGLSALTAYADGDIVYAARYYLPPGSRGTSHFHLYRINPDGTGKRQLTYGNNDDDNPQWSPDGTLILFERNYFPQNRSGYGPAYCCISADGGVVKNIVPRSKSTDEWNDAHWLPHDHTLSAVHSVSKSKCDFSFSSVYLIDAQTKRLRRFPGLSSFDSSPDGKYALTTSAKGDEVYNTSRGTCVPIPKINQSAIWLDNQTFAALIPLTKRSDDKYNIVIFSLDGRKRQQLPYLVDSDQVLFPSLLDAPKPFGVIYDYNAASPSYVDFQYFEVNLKTAKMCYFTHGQFFTVAPDGRHFCTAPQRATTSYANRRYQLADFPPDDPGGKYHMVYASPLYIHDTKSGQMHQITSRLSWVIGADWRKAGP